MATEAQPELHSIKTKKIHRPAENLHARSHDRKIRRIRPRLNVSAEKQCERPAGYASPPDLDQDDDIVDFTGPSRKRKAASPPMVVPADQVNIDDITPLEFKGQQPLSMSTVQPTPHSAPQVPAMKRVRYEDPVTCVADTEHGSLRSVSEECCPNIGASGYDHDDNTVVTVRNISADAGADVQVPQEAVSHVQEGIMSSIESEHEWHSTGCDLGGPHEKSMQEKQQRMAGEALLGSGDILSLSNVVQQQLKGWADAIEERARQVMLVKAAETKEAKAHANRLEGQIRLSQISTAQTERQLTGCKVTADKLREQNQQLQQTLAQHRSATAAFVLTVKQCRERIGMMASEAGQNQSQIADLETEIHEIQRGVDAAKAYHNQTRLQLETQIRGLVNENAALKDQISQHASITQHFEQALRSLQPDWSEFRNMLNGLSNSLSSCVETAVEKLRVQSREISNQDMSTLLELVEILVGRDSAAQERALCHNEAVRSMLSKLDELIARPHIIPSSPAIDTHDLVCRIRDSLLGNVATNNEQFPNIAQLLEKVNDESSLLRNAIEVLTSRSAKLDTLELEGRNFHRKLEVVSGELLTLTLDNQFLRKENVRISGERVEFQLEASNNRAGLSEWKAEAALLKQQIQPLQARLEGLTEERRVAEAKIYALQHAHSPALSSVEIEVVREQVRQQVLGETAAELLNKENEYQTLREEQYRQHRNEIHSLNTGSAALQKKFEAVNTRYSELTDALEESIQQQHRMRTMRDEDAQKYKTLDASYRELLGHNKLLEGKFKDHLESIKELGVKRSAAVAELEDERQKSAQTELQLGELEEAHRGLAAELEKLQRQSSEAQETIKEAMSGELNAVKEMLTTSRNELAQKEEETSQELESLVQKTLALETELEQSKASPTLFAPNTKPDNQGDSVRSPIHIPDDEGAEYEDDDEGDDDAENEDDEGNDQKIESTDDGTLVGSFQMVPRTPYLAPRPPSAIANSGSKRTTGLDGSQRPNSQTSEDLFSFNPHHESANYGALKFSLPRIPPRSSDSWPSTYAAASISQPRPSRPDALQFSGSPTKRPTAGDHQERKLGKLPKRKDHDHISSRDGSSSPKVVSPDRVSKHTRQAPKPRKSSSRATPPRSSSTQPRRASFTPVQTRGKASRSKKGGSEQVYLEAFDRYQ
ncbi:Tuberous sclerosis 1 [Sphaceloma murrayae]|uniref:Tuberous sclerosis 1 n=1 Tax=Sphaceloma murrayae TaxID=2082308 RepID=A0A2K1QIY3_9PEZI|nr:Tuberous sclerosis 1 [Sphaceloma murrayae]